MKKFISRFLHDASGATAIEYALIASIIALAIIPAVNTLGSNLNTAFQNIAANLK